MVDREARCGNAFPLVTPMHSQPDPPLGRRQFTLAGLLWFVVACSAFLSQGATVVCYLVRDEPILSYASIVPWAILAAFYARSTLEVAMLLHCVPPAFLATTTLTHLVGTGITDVTIGRMAVAVAVCFSAGSLAGLLGAAWQLMLPAPRSRRP